MIRTAPEDGYIRVSPSGHGQIRDALPPDKQPGLIFVDVAERSVSPERVVDALKGHAHRFANTDFLLIRWPVVRTTTSDDAALKSGISAWFEVIAERSAAIGLSRAHIGIVVFSVGEDPYVEWLHPEEINAGAVSEGELLQRALIAEFRAMLDWGHAVWRPRGYHYELPSGDHAGAFVRVGDSFRTPRDARVLSTWIASRLRDGTAIVADSATLVPLVSDLHALIELSGWEPGRVEMLDEYPRTRFDVMRAIRPLQAAKGGVLGLLSVNASGRYRDLMLETLSSTARNPDDWSMIVLVDKSRGVSDSTYAGTAEGDGDERVSTWVAVSDQELNPLDASSCELCRRNERAQIVRIDPRTFEALALPGVLLMTPDVPAARRSVGLWDSCFASRALGVQVNPAPGPSAISRPEGFLGVRVHFDKLLTADHREALCDRISERLRDIRRESEEQTLDYRGCDGVVVSRSDAEQPGFGEVFGHVMANIGLEGIQVTVLDPGSPAPDDVAGWNSALVFSLGCVTGWNLRQLHLAVEDSWQGKRNRNISALVLHARPSTTREWVTLGRSFRDQLMAVWLTFLPWRSPIAEEAIHLNQVTPHADYLTDVARNFLTERKSYCTPRSGGTNWDERVAAFDSQDGSPDPYSILWGMSPRGGAGNVRTQSNFGYEVDAVTAYAAMGAAMQSARLKSDREDPRWGVFEFPAIARSYYDGVVLACILRWCEPQEAWWGQSGRQAANVMSELIARTADASDQQILFPELLLAASQGKIPWQAVEVLVSEAASAAAQWPESHRGPVELGTALWRAASIQGPP